MSLLQGSTSISQLWLQQQAEECVQALDIATPALQPLFLQIAGHDQGSAPTNKSTAASLPDMVCSATAAQVSSNADGLQQSSGDSSGNVWDGSRGNQAELAWTAMTVSLRTVLQSLQQRQLLGTGLSPQQALAAFQDACYPGSEAQRQG